MPARSAVPVPARVSSVRGMAPGVGVKDDRTVSRLRPKVCSMLHEAYCGVILRRRVQTLRLGRACSAFVLGKEQRLCAIIAFGLTSDEDTTTTQSDQQIRPLPSFLNIVLMIIVARVPSNMPFYCLFGWLLAPPNSATVTLLRCRDSLCTRQCRGGEAGV